MDDVKSRKRTRSKRKHEEAKSEVDVKEDEQRETNDTKETANVTNQTKRQKLRDESKTIPLAEADVILRDLGLEPDWVEWQNQKSKRDLLIGFVDKKLDSEKPDKDPSWVAELITHLVHDKVPNPAIQLIDTIRRKDPEISKNVERRFECALMETIGHWDEKKQKELYDSTKTMAGDPTIAYCPTVGNRAVFDACGIEIVDDMRIKLPPNWTINHTKSFDEAHSGRYALGSRGYTYVKIDEHGVAKRTLVNIGEVDDIEGDPGTEENYRKLESLGMRRTKRGIMVPPGWHACYIDGGARGADLYYPVFVDRKQITQDNLRATIDEDGHLHIHDPKFVQAYQQMRKTL